MSSLSFELYFSENKLILAIVLSILTYWLFAQSFINISTQVQQTYQTTTGIVNLSVSLTSFATGIFMVGAGDVSDKIGKLKMMDDKINLVER